MRYEDLAPVYDRLTYDQPAKEWAKYLFSFLGGASSVLEYGCGTGRITEELAKAGLTVTALDISEEMLNEAQRKLQKTGHPVRFVCALMEEFTLARPVNAAICACDGVNYLLEEAALRDFFGHAAANLVPGGVLLFDISSRYKLEHVLADSFFYDDGEDETLFWQNSFDAKRAVNTMNLTVFVRDGRLYRRFDEEHLQKAWDAGFLQTVLEESGFSHVEMYAFGTKKAPDDSCERIQFVAVK